MEGPGLPCSRSFQLALAELLCSGEQDSVSYRNIPGAQLSLCTALGQAIGSVAAFQANLRQEVLVAVALEQQRRITGGPYAFIARDGRKQADLRIGVADHDGLVVGRGRLHCP